MTIPVGGSINPTDPSQNPFIPQSLQNTPSSNQTNPFLVSSLYAPVPRPGGVLQLYGPMLNIQQFQQQLASQPLSGGQVGPISPNSITLSDGTFATPSLNYVNSPNSGLVRYTLTSHTHVAISVSGNNVLDVSDVGIQANRSLITTAFGGKAPLNIGSESADPSAPNNGDIWYNSTFNTLRAQINGVTTDLTPIHTVISGIGMTGIALTAGIVETTPPKVDGTTINFTSNSGIAVFMISGVVSGLSSLPSDTFRINVDGTSYTLAVFALQIGAGDDKAFDATLSGSIPLNLSAGAHTAYLEIFQSGLGFNASASTPLCISVIFPSDGATSNVVVAGSLQVNGDIGFFGTTPIARPAAYTLTYPTGSRTLNAYTSDPQSTPYLGINGGEVTGDPYAQVTDLNALRAAYENLRTSYDNEIQVLRQQIADLQAYGLDG